MHIKKAVSIFLIAASLALSSCTGSSHINDTADALPLPEDCDTIPIVKYEQLSPSELLASLESIDYGGYKFTIATSDPGRYSPDEDSAGIVNPMLEKRNEEIGKKFNVKITEMLMSESDMADKLRSCYLSGAQLSDLVSLTADTASMLASEGSLMNLYSVPYFSYNNGYSVPDIISRSTAKDEMYILFDPSSLYYDGYESVVVNLSLLPKGAKQELLNLVNSGNWTWENMLKYAEEACTTLDKRSPDFDNDIFGYSAYEDTNTLKQIMFIGGGYSFFGDVCHKNFEYRISPEKANEAASIIKVFTESKSRLDYSGKNSSDIFIKGRCAFFITPVDYIVALDDVNFDWIVLPYPKLTNDQEEYLTCISKMAYGLCVPENQTNSIRTGNILRALRASSSAGYDSALLSNYMTFYLRDNDSAVMLGKVLETKPVTDVMLLFCEGNVNLTNVSRETLLEAIDSGKDFEYLFELNKQYVEKLNTNGLK